ncbi:MAG: glutathione S-transferase family protein, partial [Hyphomicrobiales bacterium]
MGLRLYDYVLSGSAYKIRLFLSLLGQEYEGVAVDFYPGEEHKKLAFLAINPAGTLPVLVDGDLTLCDTQAILVYLAAKYDTTESWFPQSDPSLLGRIMQWLAFAGRLTDTVGAARLHDMIGRDLNVEAAREGAHKALRELEAHLTEQGFRNEVFITGKKPTIADIACFPYSALSPDGGIEHDDYPALRKWMVSV